ncbi:MAG: nuclear transport factor 2 family protein [Pseudomonadota bacterium]|nr:nuclear transport factor 2 family protein [Pseudomonadota bacterium]
MRMFLSFVAALLLVPAAAFADDAADKAAIEAAVLDYFHGQGEGSIERLNRAFDADNATMVGVMKNDDGSEVVKSWKDMNEVLANWSKEPNPAAPARDGEILDMHVVDGRIATVLFRSTDRFYDALTLAKVNGQWKIVAKAFVRQ